MELETWAVHSILEMCPEFAARQAKFVVFTDDGYSESQVQQLWGSKAVPLLDRWHLQQRLVNKHRPHKVSVKTFREIIGQLLDSPSEAHYRSLLGHLRADTSSEVESLWLDHYHPQRKRFLHCMYMRELTLGLQGSSIAEGTNARMKAMIGGEPKGISAFLVQTVHHTMEVEAEQRKKHLMYKASRTTNLAADRQQLRSSMPALGTTVWSSPTLFEHKARQKLYNGAVERLSEARNASSSLTSREATIDETSRALGALRREMEKSLD